MKKILILIPAYNCGSGLECLIQKIRQNTEHPILVVDDGSGDETRQSIDRLGVTVLRHSVNQGKGAALQTGFAWAVEQGYEEVITLDSDGQHDPSDLLLFIRAQGDLAVGQRELKPGRMPIHRIFSNRVTSAIVSFITGCAVRDSQCGYRKIRLSMLEGFKPRLKRFQFETELLLYCLKCSKAELVNVPIKTLYLDEKSHIRHVRDTLQFIQVVWRYLWISA